MSETVNQNNDNNYSNVIKNYNNFDAAHLLLCFIFNPFMNDQSDDFFVKTKTKSSNLCLFHLFSKNDFLSCFKYLTVCSVVCEVSTPEVAAVRKLIPLSR